MSLDKTRQAIEREYARLAKLRAWYDRHPRVPGPYQRDRLAVRLAIIERQLGDLGCLEAVDAPADRMTSA